VKRFLTTKGLIGLALIVLIFAVGMLAPFMFPASFGTRMQMALRLKPPTFDHPLGTDQLGRDLLYRVLLGARTSLTIAGAAVLMSVAFGLPLGLVSGYFRGWLDNVLMLARIIRGEALRVAQMPYVEAARAAGTNDLWMIIRHVLPNVLPLVIVQATISLAFAILAEAGLSFLGLGTQPPQSSWGLMIQASRDYLDVAPWTALVPGCAVALTVLGLNMFGDVLRDVLDPRSR
jgi:ABC-type dipeptide/oligopeptide/nickel transport system permease subunit